LQDQKEEREARAKIRDLRYSSREHTAETNPFLLPPGKEARQKQSEFILQHQGEQHVIDWYRKEAETPVSLNFDNLTTRAQIARRNPVLGAIFEKARQLHAHFLCEDQARLEQEVAQRQAQLQQTQRQLASVK
jgi:hypothetical protein